MVLRAHHHGRADQGEHPARERDVRPRVRHPEPVPRGGGRGPTGPHGHRGQPGAQDRPAEHRPTADVRRRHTSPLQPLRHLFAHRHDK
ncbi:hypothetical protein SHJGH_5556 [Streptomyces hygroscopicus subsp. jinggangensis TL01]|nr:hypothetical protein SHJGH_5556 [Streptomyces hygroscopicus subsp. jinggangensis TL01]